jgi:membrane protease subunit HflK
MKRLGFLALVVALAYASTGLYVVRGNERAVVRRFGRVITADDDKPAFRAGGLHYDLPWPFSQVDRVNLNAVRAVTIGLVEVDLMEQHLGFLQPATPVQASQFLTGDKNILNLQLSVQYRVSEQYCRDFLFSQTMPEERLKLLAESSAADLISRSGVDFVHPLGLGELSAMLTAAVRRMAKSHRLGVEVDEVTINSVTPPASVKADFLDVVNARNDRQRYINSANAYAVGQRETARAEAQSRIDSAEIYRQQTVESARGKANSFTKLIEQLRDQEQSGLQSYAAARQMAMQRLYVETMSDVLKKVAGKVFLDSGKEVDLTIFRDPEE